MIRESVIENYLVSECKKLGIKIRKVQWIGRRGCPDRLLIYKGGVFVELKRPKGGELSFHQIQEQKMLVENGFKVVNICTKEEVDQFINSEVLPKCKKTKKNKKP